MVKKKDTKKIADILRELLQEKGIHLEKVVVFGSYAKRTYKGDSDIDIMVVSRAFEDKDIFERAAMTSGIHRELVRKIMTPIDIIYLSTTEWENGNSLIVHYAKEGEAVFL